MRPLTVVNGLILGSCLAIAVSLAMVLVVFLVLGEDHPRLASEHSALRLSLLIFTGMTVISALSFYGLLIQHRARYLALSAMLAGLIATGLFYWP